MKVLVCGAPGSGNRLVRETLRARGVEAEIVHWPDEIAAVSDDAFMAVVVIRSMPFWDLKAAKAPKNRKIVAQRLGIDDDHRVHATLVSRVLAALTSLGVPTVIVTYEAIVAHPEIVLRWLIDANGGEDAPRIPIEVFDSNVRDTSKEINKHPILRNKD